MSEPCCIKVVIKGKSDFKYKSLNTRLWLADMTCGVLIRCLENQINDTTLVHYTVMVVTILCVAIRTSHLTWYLYILTCSDLVGVWKAISAGITILQYASWVWLSYVWLQTSYATGSWCIWMRMKYMETWYKDFWYNKIPDIKKKILWSQLINLSTIVHLNHLH